MFKSKDTGSSSDAMDTLIGEYCTIKGTIDTEQSLKIDGQIEGNVSSQSTIILGEKARIKGDVRCARLIVYGSLHGKAQADSIQLFNSARTEGDLVTASLQIEPGAIYHGNIEMSVNSSHQDLD